MAKRRVGESGCSSVSLKARVILFLVVATVLFEAGIVDPTRIVRAEVENAVSVAAMILLAETVVTEHATADPASLPTWPHTRVSA